MFKKTLLALTLSFTTSTLSANESITHLAEQVYQSRYTGNTITTSQLSVNEKYQLDNLVREKVNQARHLSKEEVIMKGIFENISNKLSSQGIYINDISENELQKFIQREYELLTILMSNDSINQVHENVQIFSSSCQKQDFHKNLSYKEKTYGSYSKAYYYKVKNDKLDFPCDIAFVYEGYKQYVYGLNQDVRDMIQDTYNGKIAYNTTSYNGETYTRVIVGVKRFKHLLTANDLKKILSPGKITNF